VAGGARVLAIGHSFWKQRFGSDPDIIGRRLNLWGTSYEIVGVMPAGFEYPAGAAFWVTSAPLRPQWEEDHEYWNLDLVGRLKPGVTPGQAQAELNTLIRRLETTDPDGGRNYLAVVRPFAEMIVGDVKPEILVLSCAAILVLLISAANVTGLLLVRGTTRRQEFSIRFALGAGRERLARQMLTEAAVIVLLGSGLALALTAFGIHGLTALLASHVPRSEGVGINPRVLGFTLGAALLTVTLLAVLPVLRVARSDLGIQLVGGRVADGARHSGRRALVVVQVALALLVLAGAGLLMRSLSRLQLLDLGYEPKGLVTLQLELPPMAKDPGLHRLRDLIDHAVARINGVPGVMVATPVLVPAFAGNAGYDLGYTAEGQTAQEMEANPIVNYEAVAPDYFRTLGIELLKGRVVSQQDREGALPIVVVNQELARLTWPGEDPIGKRLKWGDPAAETPWRTVVGVVGNTRYRELSTLRPTVYVPYRQAEELSVHVLVRSRSRAAEIVPAVRHALGEANLGVTIVNATTMAERLAVPLAQPRFIALILTVFAALALVLAVVGLYGVIAATVVERTREIGVRIALGAQPRAVRWLVLRQGLILTATGAAIGLATCLAVTRMLSSVLYEVSPSDPVSLAAAAAALLLVALLACYIPARRATRVDPIVALRAE
jgi:predicted permease